VKIVEITDEVGLLELSGAWEELLEHSASATIFLTWEWATAWWKAYGTPGELRILLAMDDSNALRGMAPMRRQMLRKYGQTFRALSFIGDGSNDSDYLDFIIRAGDEPAVIDAFLKYWEAELSMGTLLQLNEIPETSPNLPLLRAAGGCDGMLWSETDVPCSTISLPRDWPTYLSGLSPRFRTKVRSVIRNLEGRSDLRLQFCEDPQQLDQLLGSLFDLHGRRWAKESKPGVFQWDNKRVFYRELSPQLLRRGRLCFSWMAWKEQILACQYGFVYRDCYFQLQEGYDPDCEHWNVGLGLRAWSIQQLLKRGISEYDFMGGIGRHKSDWGSKTKLSKRVILCAAHARNSLFCLGPQWEAQARESVKKWIPKSLLVARQARQQPRRREESQGDTAAAATTASKGWVRSVLATCYFQSPLPSVLPPLRDRYQLRLSPNGMLPRISLQARLEPSARILYFHRVNDEGDPFIGSISGALFEQQMKYVARYYRVVTLAEVTKRLTQGGPPEPVVAITFDDGYKDNYLNAFPILQRYGLPATIFLTTGSVDSRERLWFERLSLAAKKTLLTFLDLEIDHPRRIWLRTPAERLRAKDQIIALVRTLPDAERRKWVEDIVTQLGGAGGDTEDTMLTWEQIRYMKRHGIDFGGHTVTHPFVSRLTAEQGAWEVSECKRRIEAELQGPVEHFAYPNGREGDFETWNKELLRSAGYRAAVSTLWGVNYPSTDPMELRRGQPWEERPAVFAAKLDWYQWTNL